MAANPSTVSVPLAPVVEPDYDARPTWDELDREALEENARDQYDGPPIAQLIREDRDAH